VRGLQDKLEAASNRQKYATRGTSATRTTEHVELVQTTTKCFKFVVYKKKVSEFHPRENTQRKLFVGVAISLVSKWFGYGKKKKQGCYVQGVAWTKGMAEICPTIYKRPNSADAFASVIRQGSCVYTTARMVSVHGPPDALPWNSYGCLQNPTQA
jgi:hypothetical protein